MLMAWIWFMLFAVACTACIFLRIELKHAKAEAKAWRAFGADFEWRARLIGRICEGKWFDDEEWENLQRFKQP